MYHLNRAVVDSLPVTSFRQCSLDGFSVLRELLRKILFELFAFVSSSFFFFNTNYSSYELANVSTPLGEHIMSFKLKNSK